MPVCPIENGYCTRHKTIHHGRKLEISQTDNEWAEQYRKFWDEKSFYKRYPDQVLEPYEVIKIDSKQLTPHRNQSNNSIIEYNNKTIMVYRTGWAFANLNICELDKNFNVLWNKKLYLSKHDLHKHAQEDSKCFVWRNQLYFSYVGLISDWQGHSFNTNQLLARLNKYYDIDKWWYPHYSERKSMEKNWQFFEFDKKLYSVYSINPHIILEIKGNKSKELYKTQFKQRKPWTFGYLRGGANPVLFNNEYYSFFHWTEIPPPGINKTYTIGVYTFESKPPFRVTRISSGSICVNKDDNRPHDWHMNTTFPCGAYIKDDSWYVSYGSYDSWCTLGKFKINEVEKVMVRVN